MSEDSSEILNKKRKFSQFINFMLDFSDQIDNDHNLSKSKPSRVCVYHDCYTMASYNFPGEKKGLYCGSHKKPGMISVLKRLCIEPGCDTVPSFNYPGEKKKLYCKNHAKDGMINIVNRLCIEQGCYKSSNYNFPIVEVIRNLEWSSSR